MHTMLRVTTPEQAALYVSLRQWGKGTLYDRLAAAAAGRGTKVALQSESGSITYGEALARIAQLSAGFTRLGINPGDLVAVQSGNRMELPLIHLALVRIGALFMPMHDSYRGTELRHLLNASRAVAAIIPGHYRGYDFPRAYAELGPELPHLRHVLEMADHGSDISGLPPSDSADATWPGPSIERSGDLAHIMLSSGTTSLPKISLFTNDNMNAMIDAFIDATGLSSSDVAAAIAPMGTGATGYWLPVLAPLFVGGTASILETWKDPARAVDLIVQTRCTYATAIPTQMILMLPALERRNVSEFAAFRFFNTAGAALPQDVGARLEALMGCHVHPVYGATDGGVPSMARIDDPPHRRLTTVGQVLPGRVCEIRDLDHNALPPGQIGEVCWTTPDKSYGYLNDMAATAAAFDSRGFYKSGDLGVLDTSGYLSIVGRIKDMILRGGRNISPLLIEQSLITHPSIREVAVAAIPHPELGEQACAFVVLAEGRTLNFADMIEHLRAQDVATWQLPERLHLMEELPKSAGGKVAKRQLTELIKRTPVS